jgi:ABC-type xylose transport system substrate-binding protein
MPRLIRHLIVPLLAAPLLSGCVGEDPTTVALLLADEPGGSATVDVEAFTERVEATCAECAVEVYDAGDDAEEQRSQARQALADEADVLVVWPVEPEEAEGISRGDTPMVSLVELVPGSDRFVGLADDATPSASGQGSDIQAAREVVLGERERMTHVPAQAMSEQAADVAVALLAGNPVADGVEHEGVTSWLYDTTDVRLGNLTTVLVGEGVLTMDDLCEGSTARRCEKLGLR